MTSSVTRCSITAFNAVGLQYLQRRETIMNTPPHAEHTEHPPAAHAAHTERAHPRRNPSPEAARRRPGPVDGVVPDPARLRAGRGVHRRRRADGGRPRPSQRRAPAGAAARSRSAPPAAAGFDYFAIGVPDKPAIEALADRLTALGEEHAGVHWASMGWILPYVHDPDGHEVRFYTHQHHTEPESGHGRPPSMTRGRRAERRERDAT